MSKPTTIHDLNDQAGNRNVETMSVAELEQWLTDPGIRYAEWRLSMDNADAVQTALNRLEEAGYGGIRWSFNQQLRADRQAIDDARRKEQTQEAREAKLKEAAREDWLRNGGDEASFNRSWATLRKTLLESGRAKELVESRDEERARRAARTF